MVADVQKRQSGDPCQIKQILFWLATMEVRAWNENIYRFISSISWIYALWTMCIACCSRFYIVYILAIEYVLNWYFNVYWWHNVICEI